MLIGWIKPLFYLWLAQIQSEKYNFWNKSFCNSKGFFLQLTNVNKININLQIAFLENNNFWENSLISGRTESQYEIQKSSPRSMSIRQHKWKQNHRMINSGRGTRRKSGASRTDPRQTPPPQPKQAKGMRTMHEARAAFPNSDGTFKLSSVGQTF